jgi:hypothetical protein
MWAAAMPKSSKFATSTECNTSGITGCIRTTGAHGIQIFCTDHALIVYLVHTRRGVKRSGQ